MKLWDLMTGKSKKISNLRSCSHDLLVKSLLQYKADHVIDGNADADIFCDIIRGIYTYWTVADANVHDHNAAIRAKYYDSIVSLRPNDYLKLMCVFQSHYAMITFAHIDNDYMVNVYVQSMSEVHYCDAENASKYMNMYQMLKYRGVENESQNIMCITTKEILAILRRPESEWPGASIEFGVLMRDNMSGYKYLRSQHGWVSEINKMFRLSD